jgi:hypothetical protein
VETVLFERHEGVLCLNYDIPPTVRMFYQTLGARLIDGGDITLFEMMFLARTLVTLFWRLLGTLSSF